MTDLEDNNIPSFRKSVQCMLVHMRARAHACVRTSINACAQICCVRMFMHKVVCASMCV